MFTLTFVIFRKRTILQKLIGPSPNLLLADCMSISYKFRTLRSGNSCGSRTQPKMSAHEDETTGEVKAGIIGSSEENSTRFFPDLEDERIKASLQPLHAQITAPTEMIDRLIQSNSAKEATTTSSRGTRHQYVSPYSEVPGSSRFPTVAPSTTAGYSLDSITKILSAEQLFQLYLTRDQRCSSLFLKLSKSCFHRRISAQFL